jgi:hypothetical protein
VAPDPVKFFPAVLQQPMPYRLLEKLHLVLAGCDHGQSYSTF